MTSSETKEELLARLEWQRDNGKPFNEKNKQREEIQKQTEEFLKRGGKIDKVKIQKRTGNVPRTIHLNHKSRKRAEEKEKLSAKDSAHDTTS